MPSLPPSLHVKKKVVWYKNSPHFKQAIDSYLSEGTLNNFFFFASLSPLQPGIEQQMLLGCQVSVMDVKLRTDSQMVVDGIDIGCYVVTCYAGSA